MQWLKRIIIGLLSAVAVMVLVIVAVIVWDVNFGVSGSDFTNTTYTTDDGTTLNGYLAQPEGEGSFPAVLMVHEWWGLNTEIVELADEMAREGFIVFAPDTYRGPVAVTIPGALYLRLTVDMQQVDADMLSAYTYLLNETPTTGAIGVVGFCYGGDVAFNHGIANPEIDAVVNLYGSTLADSDAFGALLNDSAPPVLGIFGADDQGIPLDDVNAHQDALASAGITHTVSIYQGVGHAFVQPDVLTEGGAPQEAWEELLAFLNMHLRPDEPAS
ncbi:MAG: dienelactone hydrolase family protein [Anaerolineae bacterium]